MGSFCSRDRFHKNGLEDVPDLAEISSIQSPDYVLERKMANIRKSISLARRRIVLSPRTSSSSGTISLGLTTTLTRTTAARVTVAILRRVPRKVTFAKSAPWIFRVVAEHQAVS